jgi:hypothetical protein
MNDAALLEELKGSLRRLRARTADPWLSKWDYE